MDVVLRRQETTAERHTCELRVLIASIVRAPPKRVSGESFSPLTKDLHGCPVLRRQETTAERHTCELRVLIASIVRAPPKRVSGESFSPLTKDLHGCRLSGSSRGTQLPGDESSLACFSLRLQSRNVILELSRWTYRHSLRCPGSPDPCSKNAGQICNSPEPWARSRQLGFLLWYAVLVLLDPLALHVVQVAPESEAGQSTLERLCLGAGKRILFIGPFFARARVGSDTTDRHLARDQDLRRRSTLAALDGCAGLHGVLARPTRGGKQSVEPVTVRPWVGIRHHQPARAVIAPLRSHLTMGLGRRGSHRGVS